MSDNDNEEETLCDVCNGSGESRYEQTCEFCGGRGVEPTKGSDPDWFPAGPHGDYGLTWEQSGITPPATLAEFYSKKWCDCSGECPDFTE